MFAGCSELEELDLGSFDTSNVKNMDRMFSL
ncbi:MAG: BspA family leucine-rich repeat surface protein [Blautia sp.]